MRRYIRLLSAAAMKNERPLRRIVYTLRLTSLIPDRSVQEAILLREARALAREGRLAQCAEAYERLAGWRGAQNLPQFEIAAGALQLLQSGAARGSRLIAAGFAQPLCSVMKRLPVSTVPVNDRDWIARNAAVFSSPSFWDTAAARDGASKGDWQTLARRLATLVELAGETDAAQAIAKGYLKSGDGARTFASDCFAFRSSAWRALPDVSDAGITADDADTACVYRVMLDAYRGAEWKGDAGFGDLPLTARLRDVLADPHVAAIKGVLSALQDGSWDRAAAIASKALEDHRFALAELAAMPKVRKIFLSGFGWSGSSAVHDALRGYARVFEMPGSGPVAHVNAGADSEPSYLQCPYGVGALAEAVIAGKRLSPDLLWNFFCVYVLAAVPHGYDEYKAVHSSRELQRLLGDRYYVLMLDMLGNIAAEFAREPPQRAPVAPFLRYTDLLVRSLVPPETTHALFNNALFVVNARLMRFVSDAVFVAVGRDIRDQFADQKRNNLYFSQTAPAFIGRSARFRRGLEAAMGVVQVGRSDLAYQFVQFERFILDDAYREAITLSLIGRYDARAEAAFFDPKASAKNIGIHVADLTADEAAALSVSKLVFDASQLKRAFEAKQPGNA